MSAILREGERLLAALASDEGADPSEIAAYATAARAAVTALSPEDGPALARLLEQMVAAGLSAQNRMRAELERSSSKRRAMGAFGQLAGHADTAQRVFRRV